MKRIHQTGLLLLGLGVSHIAAFATPIVVTSAQINAYFGTATLLGPGGATLFTRNYVFLSNPISPDLAAEITADANANVYPIFQNNVTAGATFDSTLFVQEISNGNCHPAGPICDPTNPLPVLPAEANLTAALLRLPVPSGDIVNTLIDSGDNFKGNLPDFVVSGPATDGTTIIQASINISLFEHDFTAVAAPGASAPEPAAWLLTAGGLAAVFASARFKGQISRRAK